MSAHRRWRDCRQLEALDLLLEDLSDLASARVVGRGVDAHIRQLERGLGDLARHVDVAVQRLLLLAVPPTVLVVRGPVLRVVARTRQEELAGKQLERHHLEVLRIAGGARGGVAQRQRLRGCMAWVLGLVP